MDRQIPRSIQYSDLKPEVIENQVKLIRFSPQTNIQNQVPNDVVRFELEGNGFYDPYSAYISLIVDFGSVSTEFAFGESSALATTGNGLERLAGFWANATTILSSEVNGEKIEGINYEADATPIGCMLDATVLNHENMIVQTSTDGYSIGGLNLALNSDETSNSKGIATMPSVIMAKLEYNAFIGATSGTTASALGNLIITNVSDTEFADIGTSCLKKSAYPLLPSVAGYAAAGTAKDTVYDSTQEEIPIPGAEFKLLDRSAHSFINRLVIRSEGTEVERIEEYDVVAAMLNDMIYSNEEAEFHSFEGFPGGLLNDKFEAGHSVSLTRSVVSNSVNGPRGRVGERIFGWAFVAVGESPYMDNMTNKPDYTYDLITKNGTSSVMEFDSDMTSSIGKFEPESSMDAEQMYHYITGRPEMVEGNEDAEAIGNIIVDPFGSATVSSFLIPNNGGASPAVGNETAPIASFRAENVTINNKAYNLDSPLFSYGIHRQIFGDENDHPVKEFVESTGEHLRNNSEYINAVTISALDDVNVGFFRSGHYKMVPLGCQKYEFIIPIYSGLIGVMMPEKKLLPLNLMPLEVDFTLNPHALIACYSNGYGGQLDRSYSVTKMEIFSHMIFFEEDVHRSMESIVADNGLFIHMNTFYMAPVTLHPTKAITNNIPINLHYKNINSIHFVHLYNNYLNRASVRKLNFVSHNLKEMEIRNGTDLIPSEPLRIESNAVNKWEKGSISGGKFSRIFIELLKSFNKMHDPMYDVGLDPGLVYHMDEYSDSSSLNKADFEVEYSAGAGHFSSDILSADLSLARAIRLGYRTPLISTADAEAEIVSVPHLHGKYYNGTQTNASPDAGSVVEIALEKMEILNASGVRGYIRCERLTTTAELTVGVSGGIHPRGSWGSNPLHLPNRPGIFYSPNRGGINANTTEAGEYFGLSAKLLAQKIERFTALAGRCQYAISLEGINMGTDNSLLCGKRGMVPFDIITEGEKTDDVPSMTFVFAKCDFIVYIRPDLVVTVLGR